MFKQKTAAVVKDPNSAVMDGPDKEGKEGDNNKWTSKVLSSVNLDQYY